MAKDRFGEDIEVNEHSGYTQDADLTYVIPAPNQHTKDLTITVKCCLCRNTLKKGSGGWCEHCQTYPINITPVRFCSQRHSVNPDGWCYACDAYVATALEPINAQWIDSGVIPKRLAKEKVKALVAGIVAKLSEPGWPDVSVPLREDMIPRRWKHAKIRTVGETPLGYKTVLPDNGIVEQTDTTIPF
jgi:hypothetical protein